MDEFLQSCERAMLPDGCNSFETYKKFSLRRKKCGCCSKQWKSNAILVKCQTCNLHATSCLCLDCFLQGNHEGHVVHLMNGSEGVCDCGDQFSIKRSGFCKNHLGIQEDPISKFLTSETKDRCQPIINKVCQKLDQVFPSETESINKLINWLKSISEWGDGYQRMVVNGLTGGPLLSIFKKYPQSTSNLQKSLYNFLISIITDLSMKQFMIDYFVSTLSLYTDLLESNKESAEFISISSLVDLDVQLFACTSLMDNLVKNDEYFPLAFHCAGRSLKTFLKDSLSPIYNLKFFSYVRIFNQITTLIDIPIVCNQLFYKLPKSFNALLEFFENLEFTCPIQRIETGDHVLHNTNLYVSLLNIYMLIDSAILNLVKGYKTIDVNIDIYSTFEEAEKPRQLAKFEDKEKLLSCLLQVFNRLKENVERRNDGFDVLSEQFSTFLPLHGFFFYLLSATTDFFHFSLDNILCYLGIESLWPYVKHYVISIAGLESISPETFTRNDASLFPYAKFISSGQYQEEYVARLYHYLSVFLYSSSNQEEDDNNEANNHFLSEFIDSSVKAYGLESYLNNGEFHPNADQFTQIALICRYFIILLSSLVNPTNYSMKEVIKQYVVHKLKINGNLTMKDFVSNVSLIHNVADDIRDSLHAVGVAKTIKGEKVYNLKPEFDCEATPFFYLYPHSDYFNCIASQVNLKNPSLLPIPPPGDPLTTRFILNDSFISFMNKTMNALTNNTNSSISAVFSYIALLQMSLRASNYLESTRLADNIIPSLSKLANIKFIEKILPTLYESSCSLFPQYREQMNQLSATILNNISSQSRKKPDFSNIKKQFMQQQMNFAQSNMDQLTMMDDESDYDSDDIDENEPKSTQAEKITCVICRSFIQTDKDDYGLLAAEIDGFYLCGHYCHKTCYTENSQNRFCPLCRTMYQFYLPINGDKAFNEYSKLIDILNKDRFTGDLIEYLHSVFEQHYFGIKLRKCDIKFIHSIVKYLPSFNLPGYFGTFLNSVEDIKTPEQFLYFLNTYNNPVFENCLALILSVVHNNNDFLTVKEFGIRKFYIDQLPKNFIDHFLKSNNFSVDLMADEKDGICKCLKCGQLLNISPNSNNLSVITEHVLKCSCHFYLALTGKMASTVFALKPSLTPKTLVSTIQSFYITETGDEDVGLTMGSFLVLDEKRRKDIRIKMVERSALTIDKDFFFSIFGRG